MPPLFLSIALSGMFRRLNRDGTDLGMDPLTRGLRMLSHQLGQPMHRLRMRPTDGPTFGSGELLVIQSMVL